MGKKRIISLVLALVMICSTTAYGAETTNWFDKAIENAVSNGLYNSITAKSLANEDLSRAEMAAVINRAFGSTTKASLDNYKDVSEDAWYYGDMAKAVCMGTFEGSEGMLSPKNKITREETFVVIARAFKLSSTDLTVLDKFSDAGDISSWAKLEIAAMAAAGYINGSDSKLNPKGNITRAEFAQIMDNIVKGYFNTAGTYTSVPSGNILINVPNVILKDVTVTGDIIIGDGVGNGVVTFDNVKVIGRTVIRGGSLNSIKLVGDSSGGGPTNSLSISEVNAIASLNSNIINVTATVENEGAYDTATIVLKSGVQTIITNGTKEIKDVPIVNGKISKTIYGLSNATYTVTVSVGNVSKSAPNTVAVFSPLLIECSKSYYLEKDLNDYDNPQAIEFAVWDDNASITGGAADYVYNVTAVNLTSGDKERLIYGELGSTQLEAMHESEGCLITCYGEYFSKSEYAITMQIISTGPGSPIVGESSFEITVDSDAPQIAIDFTNECINGYDALTMEYSSWDKWYTDVDWSKAGSLTSKIDNNNFFGDMYFRYKATESAPESYSKYLYIYPRPIVPTGLMTVATDQGNDGKITLLSSANYQYKLYNADLWSGENLVKTVSAETYEIDSLAAGTYYVREKATENSFASLVTTITVFANGSIEPAAPKLVSVSLNEDSTKIYLNFDKAMSPIGLEKFEFRAYDASGYGGIGSYEISSVGLKQGDSSSVELSILGTQNYYPIGIAYTSGTALADDGGALATFSGINADNMHLELSLDLGNEVYYYGTISLSSVKGIGYYNLGLGYIIAADSTDAPAAGTQIDTIENIKELGGWNYPILGDIKANTYLVLYSYDNNTGMINGFGQVKITEENIGNVCNAIQNKFESIEKFGQNGITKYAISYGTIAETQTVTPGGINASDVTITTISGIRAYVVNTSDIAKTGGTKNFTLTLSGDETNGQTNGVYTVKITIATPTPLLEVDKTDSHRLNVSGASPGAKINLYIIKDGYLNCLKIGIADEYGNAFFEGLEANNYYVDQTPILGLGSGIISQRTMQVTITE